MDRINTTLEVLIVALANATRQASRCADMAETAIVAGYRNGAIGCLAEAETAINDIRSLRDAIYSIQRPFVK